MKTNESSFSRQLGNRIAGSENAIRMIRTLTGLFVPKTDPQSRQHAMSRLATATVARGDATDDDRIFSYGPSWAPQTKTFVDLRELAKVENGGFSVFSKTEHPLPVVEEMYLGLWPPRLRSKTPSLHVLLYPFEGWFDLSDPKKAFRAKIAVAKTAENFYKNVANLTEQQ